LEFSLLVDGIQNFSSYIVIGGFGGVVGIGGVVGTAFFPLRRNVYSYKNHK